MNIFFISIRITKQLKCFTIFVCFFNQLNNFEEYISYNKVIISH